MHGLGEGEKQCCLCSCLKSNFIQEKKKEKPARLNNLVSRQINLVISDDLATTFVKPCSELDKSKSMYKIL